MKVTKEFLKQKKACIEGYNWFYKNCLELELQEQITKTAEFRYDWANWLMVKLMKNHLQKLQYAIFAAEQVLPIFEEKYPKNKRAREAIEATKKVLENNTEENRRAAYTAAYAAYPADAAFAAYAADDADAAAYAAANAAYAAAYAADDAYTAVVAAAADAAYTAAYAADNTDDVAVKQKIINYGIKLIKE